MSIFLFLVPRPLYFVAVDPFRVTWSERSFRPFVSVTSPKWIDRGGLGKSRRGTRQDFSENKK